MFYRLSKPKHLEVGSKQSTYSSPNNNVNDTKDDNDTNSMDLSLLIQAQKKATEKLENRPLQTQLMRDQKLELKRKKFPLVKIKFQFSIMDYFIIAKFQSSEKVFNVFEFLHQIFPQTSEGSMTIKSIRPFQSLEFVKDKNLFELGLYPASLLLVSFKNVSEGFISENLLQCKLVNEPEVGSNESLETNQNSPSLVPLIKEIDGKKVSMSEPSPNQSFRSSSTSSNKCTLKPKWMKGIIKE